MTRLTRLLAPLAAAVAAALCTAPAAAEPTTTGTLPATSPALVTTGWLAENLDQPNLRILDARNAMRAYQQAHVPGAVYLNTESLRISRGGIPGRTLPPDDLARLFGAIGVGNGMDVVVYSGGDDLHSAATYVAVLLEFLGHDRVAVLDGGWDQWKKEGRPTSSATPAVPERRFAAAPREGMMLDADAVRRAAGQGAVVLDARPADLHAAGRIPGSRNLPLAELLADGGMWKSPEELRTAARQAGVEPGKPVVAYCNTGREASQLAFTLKHVLGIEDVRIYPGSMVDWRSRDLPLEP